MDLNQQKLSKKEWDTTEIPINSHEKEILNLIIKGYDNVNIVYNKNQSMINFLALEPNDNIINHIYKEYFKESIIKMIKKYDFVYKNVEPTLKFQRVNSVEKLKLENISKNIKERMDIIFEFHLLALAEMVMKCFYKNKLILFKYNFFLIKNGK